MWNSKHNTYGLTYPLDANLGDSSSLFAKTLFGTAHLEQIAVIYKEIML